MCVPATCTMQCLAQAVCLCSVHNLLSLLRYHKCYTMLCELLKTQLYSPDFPHLTEAPPPYPAQDDEEGWGDNEFEGSDEDEAGGGGATLQFHSDNSTEHQCMEPSLPSFVPITTPYHPLSLSFWSLHCSVYIQP